MADPEKGLPAEQPAETGTPPDPTATPAPVANEPDVTPQPEATPAPAPEAAPAAEEPTPEPAKPSLSDYSLDQLLEHSGLKEHIETVASRSAQSATDKAEARAAQQVKQNAANARAEVETSKRRKLVEDENFDQIGRDEVAQAEANERLMESLSTAQIAIAQQTTEQYTRELGEETVDRIIKEQAAANTGLSGLQKAYADEVTRRAVETAAKGAIEAATKTLDEKFEARLAEAGLAKRDEEVAATGPVEKVSGTPPVHEGSEEPKTWETEVDKYNAGEISWTEMEPYQKAHDEETGGSGMRG